eukprot:GHVO01060597.1.p6 GENE.GHVO01060597.1~~GHVO01060597.1.p6  ORF type:complete len:108 (-),score=16.08 GHVO01060597.1:1421-1744(-)
MVDAKDLPAIQCNKNEQQGERVLGLSDTIDITGLIFSCEGGFLALESDDYEEFMEDLRLMNVTAAEIGRELGLGKNTVYSWKQWTVPQYAKAYVELKLKLHDLGEHA